jgi:hypothetical protein
MRSLFTPAALCLLLCAARAQQGGGVHPPSPVEVLRQQAQQTEDEMVVLFGKVEQRLQEIDQMLFDASAGRPVQGAVESGLDELLARTRVRSEEVLEGIDRILELAQQRSQQQQQMSGGGGEGGPSSGKSQSSSPLDQQSGQQGQREQTPEGPSQKPSGSGQDDKNKPGEGPEPKGSGESQADAENKTGKSPPKDPTERGYNEAADGRWGDLPVHVRELFRAQGGADMPPHYRDWIDAYYRRLNRKP